MKNVVTLTFNKEQLESAMSESSVVRSMVVKLLFPQETPAEELERALRKHVSFHSSNYIEAIKFVRQYAAKHRIDSLFSLADAKFFVDKLNWPR